MNDVASMSNAAMWAAIVGFFLPIAASVIIQTTWGDAVKAVAGFCCCLTASLGTAWFSGLLTPGDISRCFLITFVLAISSYYGFWKPTGVAPKLEAWTTLSR